MLLKDKGLTDKDFTLIINEDRSQIDKWGLQEHDAFEWLAYLVEEVGELSEAISEYCYRGGRPEAIVKEALQTATLALKMAVMVKHQLNLGITEDLVIPLLKKQAELLNKETNGLVKGVIGKKEHFHYYHYLFDLHSPVLGYDYHFLHIMSMFWCPVEIDVDEEIRQELSIDIEITDSGKLLIYSLDQLEEVFKAIFATEKFKRIVSNIMLQAQERQDEERR